jgi:surface protein
MQGMFFSFGDPCWELGEKGVHYWPYFGVKCVGEIHFNSAIGGWNTAKVTDMSSMFFGNRNFNQPIGNWDTAKVITMVGMFSQAAKFNQPIGNWNTSRVTTMEQMFTGIGPEFVDEQAKVPKQVLARQDFNQDLGNWDTGKVTNMEMMFAVSWFNHDIGKWDTSRMTTMVSMFWGSKFNHPLCWPHDESVFPFDSQEEEWAGGIGRWGTGTWRGQCV